MEGLRAGVFGLSLMTFLWYNKRVETKLTHKQACFGGMLFGMDSGIIGGVLTMPPFMA